MAVTVPSPILTAAWCSGASGTKGYITTVIPSGAASPAASLADGFPLTTMQSVGMPMKGADMNGILNWLSQYCLWAQAGGQFGFNAGFASAPGYPAGAVIQLNSGLGAVMNLAAGNTNDPNSVMTNWVPWAGNLMADKASLSSSGSASLGAGMVGYSSAIAYGAGTVGYALNSGTTTKFAYDTGTSTALAVSNGVTAPVNGMVLYFKALNTCAGNPSLNLNTTGAVAIQTSAYGTLIAGDIAAGNVYGVVYDSTAVKWILTTRVPSQKMSARSVKITSASNASATLLMYGLSSGGTVFTATSPKMLLTITCTLNNGTAGQGVVANGAYGTGTGPAQGAAAVGTTFGLQAIMYSAAANQSVGGLVIQDVVSSLTVGTTYWMDLQFAWVTGGTANVSNAIAIATEI